MDIKALISAIQVSEEELWPQCIVPQCIVIDAKIDFDAFCIKTSCSDCMLGVAHRTTNQRKALVCFLEELNG